MKTLRVLIPILVMLMLVAVPLLPVPVHAAGVVQITQDNNSSCNSTQQLCPDLSFMPGGPSSGSQIQVDSKGNLIVAFSCSQFANCNGGHNHFGFLAWSNDKGATWTTCSASGDCPSSTQPWTSFTVASTQGATCFYSAAIFVSGTTLDFAYGHTAGMNGQITYYVDRFTITYSGNAITKIDNTGPLTTVVNNGISDSTPGFSCVQQAIQSPNANEIIVGAFEPNSGPLYLFRTGITTSAYKAMDGTASSITGSTPGRYDSVNGCIAIQPATNDLWAFQVDQAGPSAFHSAQFAYSAGNWGTAVTNTPISSQGGSPPSTSGATCAVDKTDNIIYFSWFKCNLSGGATCGPFPGQAGGPGAGTTCSFQLWEATSSSSGGVPTQLSSLNDPGACHASQDGSLSNFNGAGGSTLTFVNGQLWLTGVDDNLFAAGCTSPITGGQAACCPSQASGTTQAACQQLFLAKYTISGNSWGTMSQYTGNPSAVMGEYAVLDSAVSGNYYLVYATCATGLVGANGGWSGAANTNDGNCGAGNTGSLWSDPMNGAVTPPPPPPATGPGSVSVNASLLISATMFLFILIGLIVVTMQVVNTGRGAELDKDAIKAGMVLMLAAGIAMLIIIGAGGG